MSVLRRIFRLLLFVDMPIQRKFLLFSVGVSFWFLVVGAIGLANAGSLEAILSIVGALTIAHMLLFLFAHTASRSLAQPVETVVQQVRHLTSGDVDSLAHIEVRSGDEIGELSARFNILSDTLRELNMFKRVIEEDDDAADVYERLSVIFRAKGLEQHRVYEVKRDGMGMATVCTTSPEGWCNPEIGVDCSLCRAKKTGGEVNSSTYPRICKQFQAEGHVHVCLPLIMGGSTGGVAQFVFDQASARPAGALRSKIELAQRFIKEALPVIEAKRSTETLRDSVLRDGLTGLHNRRFLDRFLARVAAQAVRSPLGLLMCDLDKFKSINDAYGHSVGDAVLRDVADIMNRCVRSSDAVVRYGGEEFLILVQDTRDDASRRIAERVRAAVESHTFRVGTVVLRGTISVGVAEYPSDACTLWECVNAADSALYAAKSGGRNRVVVYSKPQGVAEPSEAAEHEPSLRIAG